MYVVVGGADFDSTGGEFVFYTEGGQSEYFLEDE